MKIHYQSLVTGIHYHHAMFYSGVAPCSREKSALNRKKSICILYDLQLVQTNKDCIRLQILHVKPLYVFKPKESKRSKN